MPRQRQRRGTVAGQRHPPARDACGHRLGRVGEHLTAGAVAQRLGIQLIGERRELGARLEAQFGVHCLHCHQSRGQVATQCELVGNPQPRRQHRGPARRRVPQRTLVRCHHHHSRTPAHPGSGGADQRRIAGIITGDDQHVQRTDPRRCLGADHHRLGSHATQRRGQDGSGSLGGTAASHPDHAAGTLLDTQGVQGAFVLRSGDGAHLRAGRRRGPQQALPVGGK